MHVEAVPFETDITLLGRVMKILLTVLRNYARKIIIPF